MTNEKPLVEILLASYKGSQKLEAQISSLFDQTYSNWSLLIRDDGSDDATKNIIEKFVIKDPKRVRYIQDNLGRLGPAGNFSTLLTNSSSEYVMLCDQDDRWLPEKIQLTLSKMCKVEKSVGEKTPVLIHSDLKVVDQSFNLVAESFWRHQNLHPHARETINRLLVQNVITGCTVMVNRSLCDLSLPVHQDAVMHDWWLALVASAFGKIDHIDQPTILYCQHETNEIGANRWSFALLRKKMLGNNGQVREGLLNAQKQARAFLATYCNDLPEDIYKTVECYAYLDDHPYHEKIYLLLKHRLFKAGLIRNLGFWVHI